MTRLLAFPAALGLLVVNTLAQELPGDSLGLIPEPLPKVTKPKAEPPQPREKSSTEQQSDDLQARIRYRDAKTRAAQDPKIQREWDRAQAAKTDPEKREALKSYYTLLCDRIVKIDSSTKPRVEMFRRSLVWRLDPNVRMRAKVSKPVEERDEDETENQIR